MILAGKKNIDISGQQCGVNLDWVLGSSLFFYFQLKDPFYQHYFIVSGVLEGVGMSGTQFTAGEQNAPLNFW